ncbi:S-adenosyl-L-methionine-dependent methyltransferase [Elsinoe ampelina]|uniref:S-adenosyl-L-methionine-dependent methyltransferase n=1 Tax=Elsinoe ampelina TaxID=302913 RepID=A0A6A6GDZ6_9PEZI|nr:S-adenosyl-L-methionine-dependent methyltransferase [Elsinoe ampelina]
MPKSDWLVGALGFRLLRTLSLDDLVRIMRMLSAEGYSEEIAEWTWSPTDLTTTMTNASLEACVVHSFDITARVQSHLPEYFQQVGYQSPTSHRDGPFQYGMQTDLSFFDFLHAHPERALTFDAYMTGNRSTRKHWLEWFPFREEVLDPWIQRTRHDDDSVLLVDMAGGRGRDVTLLTQRFPEARSHVVLQDLAGTLQDLRMDRDKISVCAHDIFAPQPITGAEIYYTHFVLHDFSDERCVIMLNHVKAVMRPHSRILLNEIVLPEQGCPSFFAAADITMMTNLSALARSEKQWRHLIESVGLEVVRIWKSPDAEDWEAVIEVK